MARFPAASSALADATKSVPLAPTLDRRAHTAAEFLRSAPSHTPTQQNERKKKKKKPSGKKTAGSPVTPSAPAAAPPRLGPVASAALTETAHHVTPVASEPPSDGFELVRSKAERRRARALESAALPVDPKIVGTVLFRPSAPGGAFRGAPRLELAAALSARPGVVVVRVNHKRNIVAADTTTRECLEELMAVTELGGIAVTARLPAERGKSTGFLHGVDGEHTDEDLLRAIHSSVPVVSAARVRPARPRPLQCRQCGRFGHVTETCRWPTGCITCGKSHAPGSSCQTVRCVNCGGPHAADTPACPMWQQERRVATIMASSTTALSRRAVRAAVREERETGQTTTPWARSFASVVKGAPAPARRPVPAPRAPRRQLPEPPVAPAPPAAPPAQSTVDQLVANLLLTMQAVSSMLPADHPLRAICLQAVAVPATVNQHG
ncbi:uncharacterized protein LOC119459253 [Dermacentor silvarum]|uniref:uncharacterized protein LOC119459253 n=1 Tax=Dermacentor silvarum TaxID=543639 RepID=UPI0018993B7E|nr:uncharacterized protein LOC119459253 [Dermacentor silvarum]